jgi:hypothetical protein
VIFVVLLVVALLILGWALPMYGHWLLWKIILGS